MSEILSSVVKDILECKVPSYYVRHGNVRSLAAHNNIVSGLDFTNMESTDLAMNMLEALSVGYDECISDIEDYAGFMGTFLNFNTHNKVVDLVSIDGKRTKIGLKLKSITVNPRVAYYQDGELFMDPSSRTVYSMTDVYVTPKNTKVGKMTWVRGSDYSRQYHNLKVSPQYSFNTTNIPGFEGFQKEVKPVVANDVITSMTDRAVEALTFHGKDVYVRGNGKKCLGYMKDGDFTYIHRNRTSTMVEWGHVQMHRVTVYEDKVIFSLWKHKRSGLSEISRTLDKSPGVVSMFKQAVLARKLMQT